MWLIGHEPASIKPYTDFYRLVLPITVNFYYQWHSTSIFNDSRLVLSIIVNFYNQWLSTSYFNDSQIVFPMIVQHV